MANNYCQSSSSLEIPSEKRLQAMEIIARIQGELEGSDEGCVGFDVDWIAGDSALWIRDDGESCEPEHIEQLAQALLDELEIDKPFVFSWAYTCSKPRIDEFGGGACAVRRNKESIWFDARDKVYQLIAEEEKEKDEGPISAPHGAVGGMGNTTYTHEGQLLSIVRQHYVNKAADESKTVGVRAAARTAVSTLDRIIKNVEGQNTDPWLSMATAPKIGSVLLWVDYSDGADTTVANWSADGYWLDVINHCAIEEKLIRAWMPTPTQPNKTMGKYTDLNNKAFAEMLDRAASCVDSAQEVNQKVARRCGWVSDGPGWWRHPEKKTACEEWELPDYMNDLNACRDMERTLRPEGLYACASWWRYRGNLVDICASDSSVSDFQDYVDASAAQRVKAFLRTIGELV